MDEPKVIDVPIIGVTDKDLELTDYQINLIRIGLMIPSPNAIYALAKEVEDSRLSVGLLKAKLRDVNGVITTRHSVEEAQEIESLTRRMAEARSHV